MKRVPLFLLAFLTWLLLAWPFGPQEGQWQEVAAGAVVALVVVWVMRDVTVKQAAKWGQPARYWWLIAYLFVLTYYVIKANVDVVYRVLHPDMPIWPGIVKVRTSLRSPVAIAALANSITLTPGTLCVNALDDGTLYVHWITVRAQDEQEAADFIVNRFDWFLKRIFE